MPRTIKSFETPAGNKWEVREGADGTRYAVAEHKTNKQPVSSYSKAKAGVQGALTNKRRYGSYVVTDEQTPETAPSNLSVSNVGLGAVRYSELDEQALKDASQYSYRVGEDLETFQGKVSRNPVFEASNYWDSKVEAAAEWMFGNEWEAVHATIDTTVYIEGQGYVSRFYSTGYYNRLEARNPVQDLLVDFGGKVHQEMSESDYEEMQIDAIHVNGYAWKR